MALISQTDLDSYQRELQVVLNELANTITKVTFDTTNDKHSSIMMPSDDNTVLKIVASNGLTYESRRKTFQRGQGFAGWIWEHKVSAICIDVTQDQRFQQEGCAPSGHYRSIVGVPILSSTKEILGAIFVQSRRIDVFDESKDSAILSYFAQLLAIIITDYNFLREQRQQNGQNNLVAKV